MVTDGPVRIGAVPPIPIEFSDDEDTGANESPTTPTTPMAWTWLSSAPSVRATKGEAPLRRVSHAQLVAARARSYKLVQQVRAARTDARLARTDVRIAKLEARSAQLQTSLGKRQMNRAARSKSIVKSTASPKNKRASGRRPSKVTPHTALLRRTACIERRINDEWRRADASPLFRIGRGKRRVRLVPVRVLQVLVAGAAGETVDDTLASDPEASSRLEEQASHAASRVWVPTTTPPFARSVGYALSMLLQETLHVARLVASGARPEGRPASSICTVDARAMKMGIDRLRVAMPALNAANVLAGA
jgi:hypothetical protein